MTTQATFKFEAQAGPYSTCCADSDLNGDGATDAEDLAAVIEAWGSCDRCAADIDQSGVVDVDDLLIVLQNWGACDDL